jgi:hypothetical protein
LFIFEKKIAMEKITFSDVVISLQKHWGFDAFVCSDQDLVKRGQVTNKGVLESLPKPIILELIRTYGGKENVSTAKKVEIKLGKATFEFTGMPDVKKLVELEGGKTKTVKGKPTYGALDKQLQQMGVYRFCEYIISNL